MFCFFKRRNRIRNELTNIETINNTNNNTNNYTNNNSLINDNIQNQSNNSQFLNILSNRYYINGNGDMISATTINSETEVDITDLQLTKYDIKAIIADNNWLYNYNLRLIDLINKLSKDKIKLESNNLKLKRLIKVKNEDYNNITKQILLENERLNNNISAIIEQKNIEDTYLCVICMDNIKDILFTPCHHSVVCNKCYLQLKECPMCRTPINSVIKCYF